jgi:hypothetical protein
MQIRFLEIAEIELEEAVQYYNFGRVGLGDDLRSEVLKAPDRIAKYPDAWHPCSGRTNSMICRGQ